MVERKETTWCTVCGARFTHAEIDGYSACPKCGDTGIPCATAEDLRIVVNWHELRILGIWAENYAQQCDSKDKTGASLIKTVHAITRRLQRQFPDKTKLTLSGEIADLRGDGMSVETHGVAESKLIPVNGPGAVVGS